MCTTNDPKTIIWFLTLHSLFPILLACYDKQSNWHDKGTLSADVQIPPLTHDNNDYQKSHDRRGEEKI